MPLSTLCSSAALTCQPRGKSWSTWTFKAATRRQVKLRQPDLDDYTRTGRARAVGGSDAGCWSFLKRRSFLQKPLAWDEPTLYYSNLTLRERDWGGFYREKHPSRSHGDGTDERSLGPQSGMPYSYRWTSGERPISNPAQRLMPTPNPNA